MPSARKVSPEELLRAKFKLAVEFASGKVPPLPGQEKAQASPDTSEQLVLYALFKQATEGTFLCYRSI